MNRITIIAAGIKMQRECTDTELAAIGRELQLRKDSLETISLRIWVDTPNGVSHIIANRKSG